MALADLFDDWDDADDARPVFAVPDLEGDNLLEALTEEECYLAAILMDQSGLDLAEFAFVDETRDKPGEHFIFRAHPYQWPWWRDMSPRQIDQSARSCGKSERILARACAFPYNFPTQESVLIAPEGKHVDSLTDRIEARFNSTWLLQQMLKPGKAGITHRPFKMIFQNGTRWYVRLPGRSGLGVKGCVGTGSIVLTRRGLIPVEDVEVGDEVWSHLERWSPVLHVEAFEDDAFEARGQGSFPILVSSEHRFYGCEDTSTCPGKSKVDLGPPTWLHADALALADEPINAYWLGPAAFPGAEPLPTPTFPLTTRPIDVDDPAFWWIVGRYVADGHLTYQHRNGKRVRWRVNISCTPAQQPGVTRRFDAVGWPYAIVKRAHSSADLLIACSTPVGEWLHDQFGSHSEKKHIPPALLFAAERVRREFLAGYMSGDGTVGRNGTRTVAGSASKSLALGIGLLGRTLGYHVGFSRSAVTQTHIMGVPLKNPARDTFKVRLSDTGRTHRVGRSSAAKVRAVEIAGVQTVHNVVSADHSFVADGIYHHNTHPIVLECDEGQDISERTYNELPEVVRWEIDGAKWLIHGVSKGVRDKFYKFTEEGSGFTVHRITALHDPNFTEETRAQKIAEYGGKDSPDFRRNFYGDHGDSMNRIVILSRLMAQTDDEGSEYSEEEYQFREITAEEIESRAAMRARQEADISEATEFQLAAMLEMLNLPPAHQENYKTVWGGMDIGLVGDPSEILIAGEYVPDGAERRANRAVKLAVPKAGETRLKILARIKLLRVPEPLMVELILAIIGFYKPRAFALDKTGVGLPIFQALQARAGTSRLFAIAPPDDAPEIVRAEFAKSARTALTVIKGYGFSEKVVIDFDERRVDDLGRNPTRQEMIDKAAIRQNAKDRATDVIRSVVDAYRFLLPHDPDITNDINAQTWQYGVEPVDPYGKPRYVYNRGTYHILDAMRMLLLGWSQQKIEEFLATPPKREPVLDIFG